MLRSEEFSGGIACRKLRQVVPTGWCRILSINRLLQLFFSTFMVSVFMYLHSCVEAPWLSGVPPLLRAHVLVDAADLREDCCYRSMGKMCNARAMPAQCTFYARLTRASRGHHAGITRASRGHQGETQLKAKPVYFQRKKENLHLVFFY